MKLKHPAIPLFTFVISILFFDCSNDSDSSDPQVTDAPAVSGISVSDITNNGNGSDLEISFTRVSDESFISEYRVFVVKTSNQATFDQAMAENVSSTNYISLSPDGSDKKIMLTETSTDAEGELIVGSVEYVVFVLTIADGTNANGSNTLSLPSSSITLEVTKTDAPAVKVLEANYISTFGNGQDLEVKFNLASNEELISEYRVYVVKASNQASFDLSTAEGVGGSNFLSLVPNGLNQKVTLNENSTDADGAVITESVEYVVFVLSIANSSRTEGKNSLSDPSSGITLQKLNFDLYVSDAGNFSSPPWQILKYDRTGQNPEVFINDNLNWPQDILFQEASNTVLISNLGSNRITKHNATTGDYIEDFATSIGGPTRMKIGPDNLLYVLQWSGNGKVFRYNLDGTFVDEFTSVSVTQCIGLDWDSNGNLYVSSFNGRSVRKFDTEGQDLGIFINSNLAGPTNIWFDDNGDLLVVDYSGTAVKRFDATGNYLGDYLTGVSNAEGVDFLPGGNILIGNGATKSVRMYNASGKLILDFVSGGLGNLLTPNAVVIRELP